jgi:hypothetical protein
MIILTIFTVLIQTKLIMKKNLLCLITIFGIGKLNAQFNTSWPNTASTTNVSNSTSTGYVGLGIKSTSTATTLPGFNFQVHGLTDYILSLSAGRDGEPGGTINYGKTARIGLTNSTTGLTSSDGGLLRMSGSTFAIENLENGKIQVLTGSTSTTFDGIHNKVYFGSYSNYAIGSPELNSMARLNIQGTDNGLLIKSTISGKYGISISLKDATDNAINVYSVAAPSTVNFRVKTNGEVFARKYTTTLSNIPDYVFDPNYNLMEITQLRNYLLVNKHLPNIPSANEYEKRGVDLGEMNRLLLEKVEELTLYILQLETRINKIENK